ncbi:hypothetical protein [Corallococcus sp. EGB]|uniref:hypothetical protein n=1 Tax=Corallococcus sp. EGB TaxID=1521117 RepID=UPI001CBD5D13|nr:hypothetical protein [Corallococcus sp. EGB]
MTATPEKPNESPVKDAAPPLPPVVTLNPTESPDWHWRTTSNALSGIISLALSVVPLGALVGELTTTFNTGIVHPHLIFYSIGSIIPLSVTYSNRRDIVKLITRQGDATASIITNPPFSKTHYNPSTGAQESASKQISARNALASQAALLRRSGEQLWRRAESAFFLACGFLGLSLVGPLAALKEVMSRGDWHYLAMALPISAVPFSIGITFLRHEIKIRSLHQAGASEAERLDRLRLALDCAAAADDATFSNTLTSIINRLIDHQENATPQAPVTSESDGDPISRIIASALELSKESITPKNTKQ